LQTALGISHPGGVILAREEVREVMYGPALTPDGNNSKRFSVSSKRERFEGTIDLSQIEFDEDVPWQQCDGIETAERVTDRAGTFLEWLMQRDESVIAIVCHGYFIFHLFSGRSIQQMFDVSAQDLPLVKLDSVGNCSAHIVTVALS